jgi:hypothetical protein
LQGDLWPTRGVPTSGRMSVAARLRSHARTSTPVKAPSRPSCSGVISCGDVAVSVNTVEDLRIALVRRHDQRELRARQVPLPGVEPGRRAGCDPALAVWSSLIPRGLRLRPPPRCAHGHDRGRGQRLQESLQRAIRSAGPLTRIAHSRRRVPAGNRRSASGSGDSRCARGLDRTPNPRLIRRTIKRCASNLTFRRNAITCCAVTMTLDPFSSSWAHIG